MTSRREEATIAWSIGVGEHSPKDRMGRVTTLLAFACVLAVLAWWGCGSSGESPCKLECSISSNGLSVRGSCSDTATTRTDVCQADQYGHPTNLHLSWDGKDDVVCADIAYLFDGSLASATCWRTDGSDFCVVPTTRSPQAFGPEYQNWCGKPAKHDCSQEFIGDGVCDGPSGTQICESDPSDCVDPEPARLHCSAICTAVAANACPADNLAYCTDSCYGNMTDPRPGCRTLWMAAYECGVTDAGHTCSPEGKSQMGGACKDAFAAFSQACAPAGP